MKTIAALAAVLTFASTTPGLASSCAGDIATTQASLDAYEAQAATQGPSLPETTAAMQHRQPTPASIAQAEASRGRGQVLNAVKAISAARSADARGDAAACESALTRARAFLAKP